LPRAQVLPSDVDYRVMLTFLDFYSTLLQFVNFKLYHTLGVRYPPVVDARLEQAATGLAALMQARRTRATWRQATPILMPSPQRVATLARMQVSALLHDLQSLPGRDRKQDLAGGGGGGPGGGAGAGGAGAPLEDAPAAAAAERGDRADSSSDAAERAGPAAAERLSTLEARLAELRQEVPPRLSTVYTRVGIRGRVDRRMRSRAGALTPCLA